MNNAIAAGDASIRLQNAGNVSREDVAREAAAIHSAVLAAVRAERLEDGSARAEARLQALHDALAAAHRDFATAYPTVLRHMVVDLAFSPAVFEAYLRRVEAAPWLTDAARLDSYADYYGMLQAAVDPQLQGEQLGALRAAYRRTLQATHDDFMAAVAAARRRQEAEAAANDGARRRELAELLRERYGNGPPALEE